MTIKNKDGSEFKLRGQKQIPIPTELPVATPEKTPEIPIFETDTISYFCYCLPATEKENKDSLYGERIIRLVYGEKFTLQVEIRTAWNDLFIKLWTNSVKEISANSILFIPSERRWWKVMNTALSGEGIEMQCILSDLTPSFV